MIILGTNSIKDTGYNVANSCRFEDGDTAYLSQTSATTDNEDKGTISVWIKRSDLSRNQIFASSYTDSNNRTFFKLGSGDNLDIFFLIGGVEGNLVTNAVYRDISAWYNIVIAVDTTQVTASNRVKLYVNGTQVTSFSTETYPAQNANIHFFQSSKTIHIGKYAGGDTDIFSGYMSEFVFVNNQQLAPTSFGEFDEDTPTVWKPKDVSGLTFGNNGFYLDFEDSGDLGDDESGNTNDFTENNLAATDQASDSPTNNFATANPLNVNSGGVSTFAEGNTEVTVNGATGMQFGSSSTLGMTAGKYYCEVKIKTVDSGVVGVSAGASEDARDDYPPGTQGGAESVGILISSGARYIDDSGATHGAATSADGIMMIALDLDNNNVYFGTGGNWFDGSGNADESNPTSAISVTAVGSTTDGAYFFTFGDGGGSSACKVQWNFGNPPFSISSGNSDANGYGNFEYSVPSGYLSLCTKNLGSDGG